MVEEWKIIKDWPDYAVSNFGLVKRLTSRNSGEKNKILKCVVNSQGYICVHLSNGSKRKPNTLIHRLVAEAFIENPLNLPQVNHIDSNRLNARVDNLEWVSCSDNIKHGYKYGLIKASGESNGHSKLTNKNVELIRSGNLTKEELMTILHISKATINDVLARRTWKHLP